jgi:TonB family protein
VVQVLLRSAEPPPRQVAPSTVERHQRRRTAARRVRVPIDGQVRDPLERPVAPAGKRLGKGALALIAGGVFHFLVLGGFLAAHSLAQLFEEEAPAPAEETEVAVLEEEPAETDPEPPAEPEELLPPDPLATPAIADAPSEAPSPPIGISADSTIEGGSGPAFRTGVSLNGAMSTSGLAQEILGREGRAKEQASEMIMTGDTVDTPAKPLASNRAPTAPGKARQNGIAGYVVVQLLVGKDGSVLESKIVRSEPAGFFDDKVMEVVPSWRFTPATYHGQPVVMRVDQKIRFDMQ